MEDKILKPCCPACGRVVAEWLRGEAGYMCPRCKTGFIISNTALVDLTSFEKGANTVFN